MRILSLPLIAFILLSILSFKPSFIEGPKRPREAWVIRSVLDKKPRMISISLSDKLWIAYNTQTASLYKAWTGGINFDGPVYTSAHGPQPTTQGVSYIEESDGVKFLIIDKGVESLAAVAYKGHAIVNNKVTLKYQLTVKGQTIDVEETPEVIASNATSVGFERVFSTSNIPAGLQIGIGMNLASMVAPESFITNGKFISIKKSSQRVENKEYFSNEGTLILNNNSKTRFIVTITPKPLQVKDVKLAGEEAVMALMAKSDCNTCHNKEMKTIGPAYLDIAKKYENTPEIRDELVVKVIQGGAGNWGQIPMTPHPNLTKEDAAAMVSYVLALDADQSSSENILTKPEFIVKFQPSSEIANTTKEEMPGIALNIYQFSEPIESLPEINNELLPTESGIANAIHFEDDDFKDFKDQFVIQANGILHIKKETNVVFRMISDDGSRLYIDDKLVIDNDGIHAPVVKDGEMLLKAGPHPFKLEYFQGIYGKSLSLQWAPYGAKNFSVIPPEVFTHKVSEVKKTLPKVKTKIGTAGDATSLESVHPSFTLAQARPSNFEPKVTGIDFLKDGRMVLSTWDSLGSVFILDGVNKNNPEDIKVKRIAFGLAEPLGLKVADDEIYVLQKQELTKLVDLNKDEIIDEYQTICNGWKVSANFHEFAFGLVYKDGFFYGTLATAINPGGASTQPQIPDRGKVVKISEKDGSFSFVASGLRTPNGIGFGVGNEIFIADNQGDWLPASKIIHLKEGAWYGSRSVDFKGTEGLIEKQPVVWLVQDEIGNSPSQPSTLNVGPYKNQMIHGDVTHGGIKRVFAEKINGEYQGVVFRFSQGLEAGVNRLIWGTDGSLYVGGIGSTGNWGHKDKKSFGLQKLTFNNKTTFEMLAVRAKPDGIEIEFTEPLKEGAGNNADDYIIMQYRLKPTAAYGGPKLDEKKLNIKKISLSADRKKAMLELEGMKPQHIVYVRLNKNTVVSKAGQDLWTTEGWYTMNNIPAK